MEAQKAAEQHQEEAVRSLLLPMAGDPLLLPSAAVAEVVDYQEPQPRASAPPWLLGDLEWRGQQVPIVSFEAMAGQHSEAEGGDRRIAVLNTLSGSADLRFIGLLTRGIPRLVMVERGTASRSSGRGVAGAVKMSIIVQGEPALIPDLDDLEAKVRAV